MKALVIIIVIVALGLVGCASQVPTPTTQQPSSQLQLQVAQHWDAAAADVARRLNQAMAGLKPGTDPLILHLDAPDRLSPFNRAFYNLLATQLIQQGFGVTLQPAEADLQVLYDVQVVNSEITSRSLSPVILPISEVIISTSVMNGDRFVTRISDIYYINEFNTSQYVACCGTPTRIMEVVGP